MGDGRDTSMRKGKGKKKKHMPKVLEATIKRNKRRAKADMLSADRHRNPSLIEDTPESDLEGSSSQDLPSGMVTNLSSLDTTLHRAPSPSRPSDSPRSESHPSTPYSVGLPADLHSLDEALELPPSSSPPHNQFVSLLGVAARLPAWVAEDAVGRELTLHDEILDFCNYASPFPLERELHTQTRERLEAVIHRVFPNARVHVFGSHDTNLHLPLSDLDVVIMGAPGGVKGALHRLAANLRHESFVTNLKVIAHARVPLVKLTDRFSLTDIDISFDQSSGLHSSAYIRQAIATYPELRPLVLTLKYFLKLHNLNEPFMGGIGSYALVMLVLSHLQMCPTYAPAPSGKVSHDLGELLAGFLRLYGRQFNYISTGLSVRDGGSYFSKARRGWLQPSEPLRLAVEDPQQPDNDVGRSSYEILAIQQAFSDALGRLEGKGCGRSESLLQMILGPRQSAIADHRSHIGDRPTFAPSLQDSRGRGMGRGMGTGRGMVRGMGTGSRGMVRGTGTGSRGMVRGMGTGSRGMGNSGSRGMGRGVRRGVGSGVGGVSATTPPKREFSEKHCVNKMVYPKKRSSAHSGGPGVRKRRRVSKE